MIRVLVLGIILVSGLMTLWAFDTPSVAYATGGPHGEYTTTTDLCAGCHRTHAAGGNSQLLAAASDTNGRKALALCNSCHDGTGSALDVMNGLRLDVIGGVGSRPAGDLVQSAGATNKLQVTVEPAARQVSASSNVTYTVHVKNNYAANKTVTPGVADVTAGFTSTVSPSTATLVAPGRTLDVTVTVTTNATVTAGKANLTTVTVSCKVDAAAADACTTAAPAEAPAVKVRSRNGAWLLGGGFKYIDGAPVTSNHFDANGATGLTNSTQPWGYAGAGATRSSYADGTALAGAEGQTGLRPLTANIAKLECVSCHNPHGGGNYRLLNDSVRGYAANVKAWDNGQTVVNEGSGASESLRAGLLGDFNGTLGKYTETYEKYYSGGSNSLGTTVTDAQANFASFCSTCHTAYPSDGPATKLSARGVDHYRHTTEMSIADRPGGASLVDPEVPSSGTSNYKLRLATTDGTTQYLTCMTCHRAHGTTAVMGQYSQDASLASGGGVTGGKSSLLYLDNRGVCQVCHQWK